MAQELISHKVLSLDFWQDTVTYAGSVMPTGTIGCVVLNIPDETITRLDAPCMILNQLLTGIGAKNVDMQLLPLKKASFSPAQIPVGAPQEEIEMFPSADVVLDTMIPNYLTGVIYGCLVEAYASENNARMTAMQSSTDSAKKMLQDLSIQFNRARQAAITQEITEVISGAKAQRRK